MRPIERDSLLFLLAIAAGSADAWSYIGLGHAFVANMTGNTVLVGLAAFLPRDFLHPAIALGCYAVAAFLAAALTRKPLMHELWPRRTSWTLLIEATLLIAAEIEWARLRWQRDLPSHWTNILLGVVAFAIGLQSGAMVQLSIPGVVTTYITGTWTTLMTGAARLFTGKQPLGHAKLDFEERLLMQAGIILVYCLSAVASGWVFKNHPVAAGGLPAVSVAAVAVYGLLRKNQADTETAPTAHPTIA